MNGELPPPTCAKTGTANSTTTDFLQGVIPKTLFSSLISGQVLQTLLVALLVGFAVQSLGNAGAPILRGITHLQRLVFRVMTIVMWAAPVGAFGAMAAVVGATGTKGLGQLAWFMLGFYFTCALFVFVVLGWRPQYDLAKLIDAAWDYQRAADDPRIVWYPG